jgi:hypothetical protein
MYLKQRAKKTAFTEKRIWLNVEENKVMLLSIYGNPKAIERIRMYKAISFIYILFPGLCPLRLAIILNFGVKTYYLNKFFFAFLGQHAYFKRS